MSYVFLDEAFVPEESAFIPVSDRGLLMGDGVYATIQILHGRPLFLRRHLKKMGEAALRCGLRPFSIRIEWIEELISCNRAHEGVWRLKIYYTGGDDPAMRLPEGRSGHLLMILKPYSVPPFGPLKLGLFSSPVITPQSGLKTLSHIGRYMIMEEALQKGFNDNMTCSMQGHVLETAFGNLFWVVDNRFYTPCPTLPLHFGITVAVAVEIAGNAEFVRMTLDEIPQRAHLFRTNAMGGIRPITLVEDRPFSRDLELEERLLSSYIQKAQAEDRQESVVCH